MAPERPHSPDGRETRLYLHPGLYDALSARPEWQAWVDATEYRAAGWLMRFALRRLRSSAMTLNGTAYVLRERWEKQDHATAALAVHEATHARDQGRMGWWPFLAEYLWWRVTHPRTPIRLSPFEVEPYALEDEVGRLLNG